MDAYPAMKRSPNLLYGSGMIGNFETPHFKTKKKSPVKNRS